MGLTKCEDCGRDVSTEAAACPNCGRPISVNAAPTPIAAKSSESNRPMQQQPATGPQPANPKKNWFRQHPILAVVLGVIVIAIIAAAASGSKNHGNGLSGSATNASAGTRTRTSTTPRASKPAKPAKPASKPTKPRPSLTGPQQQAVEAAQNYLSMGEGFSRAGLIQQLSSAYGSGFPQNVAVFAVNYLNVNWDEQAVQAAKNYKSTVGGFSCSGMIQQLSSSAGSGFTYAQAVYGAKRAGVC